MAVHAQTNYILTTKPAKTSLLGGHFIYRVDTTQGTLTPSSANIIQNAADNPQQWGYNTHIGANGIKLRYNEITLSEWKADRLTFYKPGTNNPSLELISGVNTALNIYNPTNNTKTLGLDISGLNFYGTSTSTPDVTLNADGLTLINGSIRGGIVGQDEFLYLSPQVYADEYEEYILSEDTEVDETKVYYIRSGEEGEYVYTEVSEPTGSPQENGYYEVAHAPGTIPIDDYVKDNWRQIIGRKFAVDTDGNLYANGLNANNAHLQQAEVEGAIIATSLTIGSGSDAYDGAAAINISGYDIEIEKNGIDEVEGVSVYLYPILYHNGVQVPTIEVDYSHFIWYQDDDTIGTAGDGNNSGRYLATYGHNYRVIYDFDDGAVGGGTEIQIRSVDPSKYITKINDYGITIHPEVWNNETSYIKLDGSGMELFDNSNNSIAQYGNTIRLGQLNNNHIAITNNGLELLANSNVSLANYTLNGISFNSTTPFSIGDNSAFIRFDGNGHINIGGDGLIISGLSDYYTKDEVDDGLENAAATATSYITYINSENGIRIYDGQDTNEDLNYAQINSTGMQIYKDSSEIASFGQLVRVGAASEDSAQIVINPSNNEEGLTNMLEILTCNGVSAFLQQTDDNRYIDVGKNLGFSENEYSFGSQNHNPISTTASTISDSFSFPQLSALDTNTDFLFTFITQITFKWDDEIIFGSWETPKKYDTIWNFTKGVASTVTKTENEAVGLKVRGDNGESSMGITHVYTMQYDGDYTFTVTSTVQQLRESVHVDDNPYYDTVTELYNIKNMFFARLKYDANNNLMPVLKLCGDVVLGQGGIGDTFIELDVDSNAGPDTDATTGNDKDLFNIIRELGWYNDVISNLKLNITSAVIRYATDTIPLIVTTIPSGLDITWKIYEYEKDGEIGWDPSRSPGDYINEPEEYFIPDTENILGIEDGLVYVRWNPLGVLHLFKIVASTIFMGKTLSSACMVGVRIAG